MALTITLPQLAAALRLQASPTGTVDEPYLDILARQLAVAEALIESFAPDAPDDVKNEAAIRLVGYLLDQAPTGMQSQNPIRHSGALSLLSPFANWETVNTGTCP